MNSTIIDKPVGLSEIVHAVEDICVNAEVYRRCGVSPGHFILNLDAGNGQTTLTAYISEMFQNTEIRRFGGLDLFLEYRLDGTMQQLKQVLCDIRSCAVYTNSYEGVIGMDISSLATHINETHVSLFFDEIKKIAAEATMVFFVPSVSNRNTSLLVKKLLETLDGASVITLRPYCPEDLCKITKKIIEESGVQIEPSAEFDAALLQAVTSYEVRSVKDAKRLACELTKRADFSQFAPKLTASAMLQFAGCYDKHREVT